MIGSTVSHYRVEEHLGNGAMGVVYRGLDLHLDRQVALKFLPSHLGASDQTRARFVKEAKAASALDHPHIVTVYDIDRTDDGQLFIAMAFYEGETLKEKLERGRLPLDQVVLHGIQVAEGLSDAHTHGIVHRDIKPSNVLVTDGKVKIIDFGLARLMEESTLTDSGAVVGTVAYMSPEQVRGQRIDHRTDIWSLGVVIYEAATGKHPFAEEAAPAAIHAILSEHPPRLREFEIDYPALLQDILDGALQKSRHERYEDSAEMLGELRRLYTALSTDKHPTEVLMPVRKRKRRRRVAAALSAGLVIAAGAAFMVLQRDNDGEVLWHNARIEHSEAATFYEQAREYESRGDARANLENAELMYRRALELEPDNAYIQAHLATLLARIDWQYPEAGRFDEAVRLSAAALAADPDVSCAWVAKGRIALLSDSPKVAVQAAEEAIAKSPNDARGRTLLGEALLALHRQDEGLEQIRLAVEMDEGNVEARPTLARLLMNLGRNEEAIAEYEKVLEYLPDSPNALNNLAAIYGREGDLDQAGVLLEKLLEVRPDDDMAAMNLGTVYFHQDRMQESIEAYLRAHELAPEKPLIMANLGDAYAKIGEETSSRLWYEKAVQTYDEEFALRAPTAEQLTERAVWAAKLGRFDEAIENMVRALTVLENDQLQPDSVVLFQAAQVYALGRRRSETLSYAEQAIATGYPPEEFRNDPTFEWLLDDPDFQALLSEDSASAPTA